MKPAWIERMRERRKQAELVIQQERENLLRREILRMRVDEQKRENAEREEYFAMNGRYRMEFF